MEALGSTFFSLFDAVSGFNQVRNTEGVKRVLVILASSGCYLPQCLTMGPTNGPEDFSFVVDTLFSLGPLHVRRLNRQWIIYIDDFRPNREVAAWLSRLGCSARARIGCR